MKGYLKIVIGIFVAVLIIIAVMFGVVYVGDWFLKAIGMSVTRAKEILFLFSDACCGLIMALGFGATTYLFAPLCWKEHKRRKQEAEEERRAVEVITAGGKSHERKD
ncbi:MAG: hypothetical protein E7G07_04665 [Flavonifractor plautii]|nr:hypothetical protein [Flavonifractor plautii]